MISKTELVNKIIKEHTVKGVSKYSKKKLSEIIHQRHPDLFNTPDTVRTHIRKLTGSLGIRSAKKEFQIQWNGFKLPEPEKNNFSKVTVNEKRIGILSDIHFPYQDRKALDGAVHHLIEFKPDCIILNGDTLDCYHLSSFDKNPKNRSFKHELDVLRNFCIQLRELFPTQRIIFKLGNHEERYERTILSRVPQLIELELFSFKEVIRAREFNIEVVDNKRIIKAGHLNIAHGHEFSKGFVAPVNPARGYYMKAKSNVIAGHNHRTSEHMEKDINEKSLGAWSTGCLCELNPGYMPINSWNHGFATVENNGTDFKVNNIKIIKGKVL